MTYEQLKSLFEKADKANKTGNINEAEQVAKEGLEILDQISATSILSERMNEVRANFLCALAESAYRKGNYNSVIELANQVLLDTKDNNFIEVKSKANNILGGVYLVQSNYEKAIDHYQQASSLFETIDHQSGVAGVNGNIGMVYFYLGDYKKSIEYLTLSLTIFERLNEISRVANILQNLGIVNSEINNDDRALDYYQQAKKIFEEQGNKNGIASIYSSIGLVYSKINDFEKALENQLKGLAIFEEINAHSQKGQSIGNIGNIYLKQNKFNQSLENYQRCLKIQEELGEKYGIAIDLVSIGKIYSNENFEGYDVKKAEEYIKKSIALSDEIGAKKNKFECHLNLSELYKSEKRWEESLLQYELYHNLEKEVQSEEVTKQAQQLEHRRKIEEAERNRQVKLARFQEQEKILLNILPAQIAERILEGEKRIADMHEHVSVFFSDIVGFTQLSQKVTPDELLIMLNEIFSEFDRIARKHGLEKIKTIGDAYMAVAGVPIDCEDHAEKAAAFALDVIEYMKVYRQTSNSELQIRVGLHCGRAIAGVIGENKFAYDLWGDSVNTASRMESHGEAGKIHVSEDLKIL